MIETRLPRRDVAQRQSGIGFTWNFPAAKEPLKLHRRETESVYGKNRLVSRLHRLAAGLGDDFRKFRRASLQPPTQNNISGSPGQPIHGNIIFHPGSGIEGGSARYDATAI